MAVLAIVGPTNTGKTTRALDIALSYPSAVFGFPLRLLARENYDLIVKRKGINQVALVTGEERIGPHDAPYFVATVEAMPIDRIFDCLVVDEIQLAADPERGHVFTNRLLYARGRKKTLFLGSQTMVSLLRRLIPDIHCQVVPRLASLHYRPPLKLHRLPRRTALISFSMALCYRLAAQLRTLHGGTAVVLGVLSPHTRNAQVDLFQSANVDYIVATDAIGLGLNLDISTIVFTSRVKYDGQKLRSLSLSELGQIAGRAGRGTREGYYTTLLDSSVPPLREHETKMISEQNFPPLSQLTWRNHRLNFSNYAQLVQSLSQKPRHDFLVPPRATQDLACLQELAKIDRSYKSLNKEDLEQLWNFCRIPNFRRISEEQHAQGIHALWQSYLGHDYRLPGIWIKEQLDRLRKPPSRIESITDGITRIRHLNYLCHHSQWVEEVAYRQEALSLEEHWSDHLHRALKERFIDTPLSLTPVKKGGSGLNGLWISVETSTSKEAKRLRQRLHPDLVRRVALWRRRLLEGDANLISLDREANLYLDHERVARLKAGDTPYEPRLVWSSHHLDNINEVQFLGDVEKGFRTWLVGHLVFPLASHREAIKTSYEEAQVLSSLEHQMNLNLGVTDVSRLWPHLSVRLKHVIKTEARRRDWRYVGGYLWCPKSLKHSFLRQILLSLFYPGLGVFNHDRMQMEPRRILDLRQGTKAGWKLNQGPSILLLGYTESGVRLDFWHTLLKGKTNQRKKIPELSSVSSSQQHRIIKEIRQRCGLEIRSIKKQGARYLHTRQKKKNLRACQETISRPTSDGA